MNTNRLSLIRQPIFWWILLLLAVMAAGVGARSYRVYARIVGY